MKSIYALVLALTFVTATSQARSPEPPFSPRSFEYNCRITIISIIGNQERYESGVRSFFEIRTPTEAFHMSRIDMSSLSWEKLVSQYKPTPAIDPSNFEAGLSFKKADNGEVSVNLFVKAAQPSDSGKATVSSYQFATGKFAVGTVTTVRTSTEVRDNEIGGMKNVDIEMVCRQTK